MPSITPLRAEGTVADVCFVFIWGDFELCANVRNLTLQQVEPTIFQNPPLYPCGTEWSVRVHGYFDWIVVCGCFGGLWFVGCTV